MSATSSPTTNNIPASRVALTGARAGSDAALRVLGIITMIAIAAQFALAGLGAFGGSFVVHTMLGYGIGLLALLIAIAALVARPNRSTVVRSLILVVLAVVGQPLFAALGTVIGPWLGALHALNGVVIAGLAGSMMGEAMRRAATRRQVSRG